MISEEEALSTLSDRHRLAYILREKEHLKYRDIAARIPSEITDGNVSIDGARSLYYHARERVRNLTGKKAYRYK